MGLPDSLREVQQFKELDWRVLLKSYEILIEQSGNSRGLELERSGKSRGLLFEQCGKTWNTLLEQSGKYEQSDKYRTLELE